MRKQQYFTRLVQANCLYYRSDKHKHRDGKPLEVGGTVIIKPGTLISRYVDQQNSEKLRLKKS